MRKPRLAEILRDKAAHPSPGSHQQGEHSREKLGTRGSTRTPKHRAAKAFTAAPAGGEQEKRQLPPPSTSPPGPPHLVHERFCTWGDANGGTSLLSRHCPDCARADTAPCSAELSDTQGWVLGLAGDL